ncbi:alpha/beta hydrolase [Azospirillum brasilense]|uniref:alpha/beta hydrolase n=1 Tax=Azospirillum brasilense TaxID=192 RepID=UPI001EDA82FC|nr:alpha/beta hydrolase [Azospirillum brasilense]UKJ72503.1 alpha/beta hydrolase [Azospirillum brasilense]
MRNPNDLNAINRRNLLHFAGAGATALTLASLANIPFAEAKKMPNGADNFYTSDKVDLQKVTFDTQYRMKVAGNLFTPKGLDRNARTPAIVVGHPMGAVKEQSANLYATKMAEQGFVAMSIDLPFWGESDGQPRNAVAPDLYAEAFSAAVDFLGTRPFVDRERIGGIGVCGSGGFLVSAAKIDPRLKAIATVSMYDMGAVTRNGYNKSQTLEQRKAMLAQAAQQRYQEFTTGEQIFRNYLPMQLPADADPVTRMYHDFYRTERGMHVPEGRTPELTQNRTLAGEIKFVNFYPFNDIETISPRPMLFIAGDQAHSREFSEDAYARAVEPKELFWVRGANHVDLYDRMDLIPWDKLQSFFTRHLSA